MIRSWPRSRASGLRHVPLHVQRSTLPALRTPVFIYTTPSTIYLIRAIAKPAGASRFPSPRTPHCPLNNANIAAVKGSSQGIFCKPVRAVEPSEWGARDAPGFRGSHFHSDQFSLSPRRPRHTTRDEITSSVVDKVSVYFMKRFGWVRAAEVES